jgi:hypothetical protein
LRRTVGASLLGGREHGYAYTERTGFGIAPQRMLRVRAPGGDDCARGCRPDYCALPGSSGLGVGDGTRTWLVRAWVTPWPLPERASVAASAFKSPLSISQNSSASAWNVQHRGSVSTRA